MADTEYSKEKQLLLLQLWISSPDVFTLSSPIVQPEYFDTSLRKSVSFILQYYKEYHKIPASDIVEAETLIELRKVDIREDEIQYCLNEIEKFCKQRAMIQAIYNAPELIQQGLYSEAVQAIRDAEAISLSSDLGVSYFENVEERIENTKKTMQKISTGYRLWDLKLGGGTSRTELNLLSANSGGGKSINLQNLAVNYSNQGLNVAYISTELHENLISKRLDNMFVGVQAFVWDHNSERIIEKLAELKEKQGAILVKKFTKKANANDIRAYIKEIQLKLNIKIDVLIVDYMDVMDTNDRNQSLADHKKDKRVSEELYELIGEFKLVGWTASQQNRSAIDNDNRSAAQIAGGLAKIDPVDNYIAITWSETHKTNSEMMFTFLKTRSSDAVGDVVIMKWDPFWLRIKDPEEGYEPKTSTASIDDKVSAALKSVSKNQPAKHVQEAVEVDEHTIAPHSNSITERARAIFG